MGRGTGGVVALAVALAACQLAAEPPHPTEGPPAGHQLGVEAAERELAIPRAVHEATLLPGGRVLLTGGCSTAGCGGVDAAAVAQVRRPDGTLVTVGRLAQPRLSHTATPLPTGDVLIVGGHAGEGAPPTGLIEAFDPVTGRFYPVGRLAVPRADHTASRLPDGRVLVAGGTGSDGRVLSGTEFIDPSTGETTVGPPLPRPRSAHVITDWRGGLLVVGGTANGSHAARGTFRYDSAAETWAPGPVLNRARVKHATVTLPNGTVVVLAGSGTVEGRRRYRDSELLPRGSTAFHPGPRLAEPRYKIADAVAVLSEGRLLVAGATHPELLDRHGDSFRRLPISLGQRWSFQTATALPGGGVFVAGGYDDRITPTDDTRTIPARLLQ